MPISDRSRRFLKHGLTDVIAADEIIAAIDAGGAGANAVLLTGDQTVAGTKTFTSTIVGDISGNAGAVTNGVYTVGNQTIGGTKTFSSTISGSIDGNAGTVTNGVYTIGDQSIGGIKTFTSTIVGSITGNAGTVTNGVYTTGDQTIAGIKTFSSTIVGSISGNAATVTNGAYTNVANTFTVGPQTVQTGSDTNIGCIIQGNSASQSADLQRWNRSDNTQRTRMDSDGMLKVKPHTTGKYGVSTINTSDVTTFRVGCDTGVVEAGQYGFSGVANLVIGSLPELTGPQIEFNAISNRIEISASDSGTTNMLNVVNIRHHTDGTPAPGFGVAVIFQLDSTTTSSRNAGRLQYEWIVATDASRASRGKLSAYSTSTEQEAIRWDGDSGGVKLGFYGVTAVARPSAYTQTYSTADKTHANATSATLTDNSGGTANTTIQALTNASGANLGALITQLNANLIPECRNNFADLAAQCNALNVDLLDLKQLVNSVIDDLQSLGLVQ